MLPVWLGVVVELPWRPELVAIPVPTLAPFAGPALPPPLAPLVLGVLLPVPIPELPVPMPPLIPPALPAPPAACANAAPPLPTTRQDARARLRKLVHI
jgi:hypothetical protein